MKPVKVFRSKSMALEKDRKSNEEVANGCVERENTKKIDDEMDGRVIDDSVGQQSLSAAKIKTREKKRPNASRSK